MVEHTRTLDFKVAFAIGLGTMIAAGIFSLSGTAVAAVGSSAVISFVIAALVAGITAASYSEFASIYSENGGGYLFCSRTFEDRDFLTYAIGFSLFLGYTGTTAFYLATMDEWFYRFVIPESLHVLPHGAIGVLAAVILGALNAGGTEESGSFQVIVTGAKVAVLFAFIGGAFAFKGPSTALTTFGSQFSTDAVNIVRIAALAFITFFGFSAIAASAGEIIEPQKTVPKAIAASIVTVTILYALVIVAMVNSPVPAEVIARQGETAMGKVAAGFLGAPGRALIVAGAIFSMVSASNASILAASNIGSLMGRRGQAPRRFSRIHGEYGTPIWSIGTATTVISALIVGFVMFTPEEISLSLAGFTTGAISGIDALNGFATLNLLLPLAVVNVALIYSRRNYDIERGFKVPGVPYLPILGVIANIALIYNLPKVGALVGAALIVLGAVAYLLWGGAPAEEDLFREVVEPDPTAHADATDAHEAGASDAGETFRVLVPVARPDRVRSYAQFAEKVAQSRDGTPVIQVLTVTQIPEQTPWETVEDTGAGRVERMREELESSDIGVPYTVEGHISRDVAFDIAQTARDDSVDLIIMGYPEEHPDVTESVAYNAPCDVMFLDDVAGKAEFDVVNVGSGTSPHHLGLLPYVRSIGTPNATVNVVNVSSTEHGTGEDPADTVERLGGSETTTLQERDAGSVAEGLVAAAKENGGVLLVGASRNRRPSRWVLGSTPDRVVRLAREADVPVIVYAAHPDVQGVLTEWTFPLRRYFIKRFGRGYQNGGGGQTAD